MLHFFGRMDQCLNDELAYLRVEEDVKLVHYSKRRFQVFAQSNEQGNSSIATFPATDKTKKLMDAEKKQR